MSGANVGNRTGKLKLAKHKRNNMQQNTTIPSFEKLTLCHGSSCSSRLEWQSRRAECPGRRATTHQFGRDHLWSLTNRYLICTNSVSCRLLINKPLQLENPFHIGGLIYQESACASCMPVRICLVYSNVWGFVDRDFLDYELGKSRSLRFFGLLL